MDVIKSINLMSAERQLILKAIQDLSNEQLFEIPPGHKNNIAWNLGHIVITQQVLHYTLSRIETHVPKEMILMYRTGTSPATWKDRPDIDELKSLLLSLPGKFEEDYINGRFKDFRSYKTSLGVEIKTFEDAVIFNHFHEGTHTGIILGLLKYI